MNPETNKKFCKKLRYGSRENPTIILGLILSQDNNFIVFRTARKKYHINIKEVLSIDDTDTEFKEDGNNGN